MADRRSVNENGGPESSSPSPPGRMGMSPMRISLPSARVTTASAQSAWSLLMLSPASPTTSVNSAAPPRSACQRPRRLAAKADVRLADLLSADDDREDHAAAGPRAVVVNARPEQTKDLAGPGRHTRMRLFAWQ